METGTGRRRPTVLVVGDEPDVLAFFRRILAGEGVEVVAGMTGAEALAIARRAPLDLVILGMELPDASGVQVLRRLHKINEGLPVIMVGSQGSPEAVRASMRSGAFDYVPGPFDMREIRQLMREALFGRARGPAGARASGSGR